MTDQTFILTGVLRDHLKRPVVNTQVQIIPVPDISIGEEAIYGLGLTVTTDAQGRVTDGIDGYVGVKLVRFDGLQYMVTAPGINLPARTFTVPAADATLDLRSVSFGLPTLPPGSDQVLADLNAALATEVSRATTAEGTKVNSSTYTAGLGGKEPAIAAPGSAPTSKYWRGDKSWQDLATDPGLTAAFAALGGAVASRSTDGALTAGSTNAVDASGGNRAVSLADATSKGLLTPVYKSDSSSNAVTITLKLRGAGSTSTLVLDSQSHAVLLQSRADGTYDVLGDHRTKTGLQDIAGLTPPTYAAPRTRAYDQERFIYRPTATERRKVRAVISRALAGSDLIPVIFLGDSHTAGFTAPGVVAGQGITGVSDPVAVFANLMKAAGYPVTGGWVFPSNGGSVSPARSVVDGRWTFPIGTWSGATDGSSSHRNSNTTNATALFTSVATGTVAEFEAFSTAATTIAYSIDGAAEVTVNLTANAVSKTVVTGLGNTTHTIQIRRSGSQRIWVGPARVRAATGLSITNAGIYGSKAADWRADAQTSAYYNPYNMAMGLETPKLVVVGLGANEALDSTAGTLASLVTDLTSVVQSAQAVAPVVMQTNAPIADASVDAGTVWTDWVKRLYDVADTTGAMLLDQHDAMGSNTEGVANGLLYDGFHPLAAGYAGMARRMKAALEAA